MRRIEVGSHVTTSRPNHLVCPACGYGALCAQGPLSRSPDCEYCCCTFDGAIVETLKQIVALSDAMGKHACECGHPEMRSLPDGTFHCPACRSEVVPTEPNPCAVVDPAEAGKQGRPAGERGERRAEQDWLKIMTRGAPTSVG